MKKGFLKGLNKDSYIILGLFILTILTRIIFRNGSVFHWDSLKDIIVIEDTLRLGSLQYSYAYGAPGMVAFVFLFYWINNLLTGTTTAETSYFFATFLTTGLSVVLLYLITKTITKDKLISFASALILSFNVIFLTVTTYPKTHAIALFFTLMSMYLIQIYNKKKSPWLLIASGACFGFSVSIRLLNLLIIFPMLFIYLNPKKKGKYYSIKKKKFNILNLVYFTVSSLTVWFLLFYNKIVELGGISQYLNSLIVEQNASVGWLGLFSKSLVISLKYLYQSITIVGLLILIIGLWQCFKKQGKLLLFLMIWIVPSLLYFGNIPMPQARFFIIILPAISILISIGINYLYKKNNLVGIIALVILVIVMFSTAYPIISYRHSYSGPKELSLWIKNNTEENSIIISNDIGWFIEYYGDRKIITPPRYGDDKEINDFIEKLKNYSKNGTTIYITREGLAIDPGQKVAKALDTNFDPVLIGEKESEIYQYSELELRKYKEQLFKLEPKFQ